MVAASPPVARLSDGNRPPGLMADRAFRAFTLRAGFSRDISDACAHVPLLGTLFSGEPLSGVSYMTAGLIVALMISPIITSITREVFATVPTAQKEGAVALGATRWEMIRGAVFPHS